MEFIIAILLIRHLRSSLRGTVAFEQWNKPFIAAIIVCGACLLLNFSGIVGDLLHWLGHAMLITLLIITLRQKEFVQSRLLIISLLPLVVVYFATDVLKMVSRQTLEELGIITTVVKSFTVVWLIGTFTLFRKQQKALEKERKLREVEAEQNRITAARKAELEILVEERTAEITRQKEDLEHTLQELRATQTQLIHAEKMASLGELTAGIAHEIQNPLNFIKNFSELNAELADELVEAKNAGDLAEVESIATTIKDNEDKIIYHSKRADGIVKSMLQHSRTGSGQKEPTDINTLADECLRLSYHGMRAKEKSFNATLETSLAPHLSQISIVPQDIGRVLLNIFTNAFHALQEKQANNDGDFTPTIWLATHQTDKGIDIVIRDNGSGIPDAVKDKIFQPFFTTKPTGHGTGLGLSISYDIITKGHGGTLEVNSNTTEGTEFRITLPA